MNQLSQLGLFVLLIFSTTCQSGPQEEKSPAPTSIEETSIENKKEKTEPLSIPSIEENASIPEDKKINQKKEDTPPASKLVKHIAVSPPGPEIKPEEKEKESIVAEDPKVEEKQQAEAKVDPVPSPAIELEKVSSAPPKEEISPKTGISHESWDQLLNQFVNSSGKVNYKGLKGKQKELEAYLRLLSDNPVQASWSRNEKMAYWINAYNAYTVKLILDNYPLSSIINLEGGKVWDKKWIKLGDKLYSLNNIENDILRPQFKDARIHFAVNCAAKSCPPLLNQAWTADKLNTYFDQQAKNFINNSNYNVIAADQVEISKIFEWYAADFGNIIDYLNKYSTTAIQSDAKVTYKEYDWALNQ